MRSKEEILKRLKKLRGRYARQYLKSSQDRLHRNCKYNLEHTSNRERDDHGCDQNDPSSSDAMAPLRMAAGEDVDELIPSERLVRPSKSTSIVVLRDPTPVRLCMYGSENPSSWAGELCDRDERAASCPWFSPSVSVQSATASFDGLMADDKYVYENYKDIAALQWVLGDRVYKHRWGLMDQIRLWAHILFSRKVPALPAPVVQDEEMEGIWRDDTT